MYISIGYFYIVLSNIYKTFYFFNENIKYQELRKQDNGHYP